MRLRVLESFVRSPQRAGAREHRCKLCAALIPEQHRHLVDLRERALCCVCQACSLLFPATAAATGRYRAVPNRVLRDPLPPLDAAAWRELGVPVRLAFVFFNSVRQAPVVVYPSPAGPTEAELAPELWSVLLARAPALTELLPDVEALLFSATAPHSPVTSTLVPIDACYQLVAHVRQLWRGFDGGPLARSVIAQFIDELRSRGRPSRHEEQTA